MQDLNIILDKCDINSIQLANNSKITHQKN